MPELPEVEAARRALEAHCVGRRIVRCAVADDPKVVLADAGRVAFERAMVGRTIVAARRRGKNLWLRLDAPPFPSFQFGQYSLPTTTTTTANHQFRFATLTLTCCDSIASACDGLCSNPHGNPTCGYV